MVEAEEMRKKFERLSIRAQKLEAALARSHALNSRAPHPLLSDGPINSPSPPNATSSGSYSRQGSAEEEDDGNMDSTGFAYVDYLILYKLLLIPSYRYMAEDGQEHGPYFQDSPPSVRPIFLSEPYSLTSI